MSTTTMETSTIKAIEDALGKDARALLDHRCQGVSRDALQLPGPDFVDRVHAPSDRPVPVLRSLQQVIGHGLTAKLSARLGEGLFNGALTTRIGIAAIDVCRPLPYIESQRPRFRELVAEIDGVR